MASYFGGLNNLQTPDGISVYVYDADKRAKVRAVYVFNVLGQVTEDVSQLKRVLLEGVIV